MNYEKQKYNKINLFAGLVMIIASVINYFFNEDFISLGVFIFAGIGFIMLSISEKANTSSQKRLKKYAYLMFFASILILIYWFLAGELNIINV